MHPRTWLLAVVFAGAFAAMPIGSTQTLVRDVNAQPSAVVPDSSPILYAESGGIAYFSAADAANGNELWRSDGTEAGTWLVKDLYPGKLSGNPKFLTPLSSGELIFVATHPAAGYEVWKTNGTEAGTVLLKDIRPGLQSGQPHALRRYGNHVYFYADDGINGYELWRTDGTAAGTGIFYEVFLGSEGIAYGAGVTREAGGLLYFEVQPNAAGDWAIWRTDGTAPGTFHVATFDGPFGGINVGFDHQGVLYFAGDTDPSGEEVWRTDGTPGGTSIVADVNPGNGDASPRFIGAIGNEILFSAWVNGGLGTELFKTDGTAAGTVLVKDIATGFPFNISSTPIRVGEIGGKLLISASDETNGRELWVTDGTTAGTQLFVDIAPGLADSSPSAGILLGGRLYFTATVPAFGKEIWATDGTQAGTQLLVDAVPGPDSLDPSLGLVVGGAILFPADDGVHGRELWRTDGTGAGTALVADIQAPPLSVSSNPGDLTRFDDRLFFAADDGVAGDELWVSDGTSAGTALFLDLNPGGGSSNASAMVPMDGWMFFAASDGATGHEPWRTDGTVAGTVRIRDVIVGANGSLPTHAVRAGDLVVFVADDGVAGREPWVTDGTFAGTQRLGDVAPGSTSSNPLGLLAHGSDVYFVANQPGTGAELWKTNGTPAGTGLVKDIRPGVDSGFPSFPRFASIGGIIYFAADDGVNGLEPWTSNGTTAGTTMLKDVFPGPAESAPTWFVEVDGETFFLATDDVDGREVWTSDGTAAGTSVAGVSGNPDGGPVGRLFSTGSAVVYFVDYNVTNGVLWTSDGTAAGTTLLAIIEPTGAYMQPSPGAHGRVSSSRHVLFAANDGLFGEEIWVSDGTGPGTHRLTDAAPGGADAKPADFVRVGGKVFFVADDGSTGRELHAIDVTAFDGYVAEPFGVGCPGTGGVVASLGAAGDASVGSPFTIDLEGALPNATTLLAIGLQPAHSAVGGGCTLYLDAPFATVALPTSAAGGLTLPVTPLPMHVGVRAIFQYLTLDPQGAYFGQASFSNALELVIGP